MHSCLTHDQNTPHSHNNNWNKIHCKNKTYCAQRTHHRCGRVSPHDHIHLVHLGGDRKHTSARRGTYSTRGDGDILVHPLRKGGRNATSEKRETTPQPQNKIERGPSPIPPRGPPRQPQRLTRHIKSKPHSPATQTAHLPCTRKKDTAVSIHRRPRHKLVNNLASCCWASLISLSLCLAYRTPLRRRQRQSSPDKSDLSPALFSTDAEGIYLPPPTDAEDIYPRVAAANAPAST